MPESFDKQHAIALDKTCELAESSATIYARLSEMAVDSELAVRLCTCARDRSQAANDLLVARQECGYLPVGNQHGEHAVQLSAMKLHNLVDNTEAMYHSLRDMDLDVRDAAREALRKENNASVIEALQSLVLSLERSVTALES